VWISDDIAIFREYRETGRWQIPSLMPGLMPGLRTKVALINALR
jgi:hypothetical protein